MHRTCGAMTRDGDGCKNPPMRGQKRCRMHGGATPVAREAAKRRIAEEKARAWLKAEELKRREEILSAFGSWENYQREVAKAKDESFEAMLERVLVETA